ncbi:MAG: tripartite tricarboxylate transporter substrate-binding protein, partial [Polaromonas sp.]|nr:tripartite tricarboxylate transporter substrate-binding protein [Polaromonas sp.]
MAQTAPAAAANALPQAPIRLIVPFTPGTGIDLIARTVGPKLSERLGRPVVVDNRAGASGNIGTEAVVRAAPNGSTLLVTVNTLVMNAGLYP